MPAGFITAEHTTLMRELIRHTLFARRLGDVVERLLPDVLELAADDERWDEVKGMMAAHSHQTEQVQRLSRALRITKASRHDKYDRAAQRQTAGTAPWLDWYNDDDEPAVGASKRRRDS